MIRVGTLPGTAACAPVAASPPLSDHGSVKIDRGSREGSTD